MGIGLPNEVFSTDGIKYTSEDGKRKCKIQESVNEVMIFLYDNDTLVMTLAGDFVYSDYDDQCMTEHVGLYLFLELFLEKGIHDFSVMNICHNLGLIFKVRNDDDGCIETWGFECHDVITDVWYYFNNGLSIYCSAFENEISIKGMMSSTDFFHELLFEKTHTLANMTQETLFYYVDKWYFDLPIKAKWIDNIGTKVFCLDHKGVKVYMYPCIYDILCSSRYLLTIDYLKTGSILKLDGETEKKLAKAKFLGVKAFIWGFNENATPKLILSDEKGEFKK